MTSPKFSENFANVLYSCRNCLPVVLMRYFLALFESTCSKSPWVTRILRIFMILTWDMLAFLMR